MASSIAEPQFLTERRERAARLVQELPLPDKRTPGWEFTDLAGLDLDAFPPAAAGEEGTLGAARSVLLAPPGAAVVTQADGGPATMPASGEEGVTVMTLAQAAEQIPGVVERHLGSLVPSDDFFVAHNEASAPVGVVVHVAAGVRAAVPVLLTTVQSVAGTSLNRRTLIVLEEGAEAEVWEQWVSAGEDVDGVVNGVVELVVSQNARLRYVAAQDLSEKAWVFGTQRAEVARDASLEWIALGFGSARGKVRMETRLAGQGAEARVSGAYAGRGRQHLDFDTTQEHAAPNTVSDLAFRGVLVERATAVWRGMIKVDKGAQKTDAFQDSRNLLLSKRAHADAIPGLEIEANDVRCTHAAAIAQVDPEQLYYLMARGLPRAQAQHLIVEGFLEALVERFPEGAVAEAVGAAIERRLQELLAKA